MSLSCRMGALALADTGHVSIRPLAFGCGGNAAGFDGSTRALWRRNRSSRDCQQRRGVSAAPPRDQTFSGDRR
jgi:hypothetical protein